MALAVSDPTCSLADPGALDRSLAGTYITKLPKAEHEAAEWQAAMEALIMVATSGGPTMFARIGVMRALNHGKPDPAIAPRRKPAKAYSVVRLIFYSRPSPPIPYSR